MERSLLASRRFAPLFWCQFFSAFNDNFLKNALALLILFKIGGQASESLVTLAGATIIAPFFLLSAFGGELADRFDKALVARRLKLVEIGVAVIAVVGFQLDSLPLLFVALFLFGVIGALFGPIKYGILPDHLKREQLPAGNALIEGATFLAILLGTIAGGVAMQGGGDPRALAVAMILFALACWGASLFIPATARAAPDSGPRSEPPRLHDQIAPRVVVGDPAVALRRRHQLFWMIGAIALSLLPPLVMHTLGGSEIVVTIHLAVFAVAIAVGSGLAAWLVGRAHRAAADGCRGAADRRFCARSRLCAAAPAAPRHRHRLGAFALSLPGRWPGASRSTSEYCGGGRAVHRAVLRGDPGLGRARASRPHRRRGQCAERRAHGRRHPRRRRVAKGGVGVAMLFLGIGRLMLLAGGCGSARPCRPAPSAISCRSCFRAFYRLEVSGLENLEAAGANPIIALNHVSFLDGAVALSILNREPVFAVDHGIAQRWWVKPFLRLTRAFPLDPAQPLATRTLIHQVRAGETLVIFPEGRITVTGRLMKVYDGAAMIAEKSGAMIVPVRIEGLEATIFSRLDRTQVRRRWFPKVTATVLEPVRLAVDEALKGKARRHAAGALLYQIMSDAIFRTTPTGRSIVAAAAAAARLQGWRRIAVEDPLTGRLSYRQLLVAARVLAGKFSPLAGDGETVGVMLPNSNGAAAAVLGMISAGRVPAMINFTAGSANIRAACTAAGVKAIVTSSADLSSKRGSASSSVRSPRRSLSSPSKICARRCPSPIGSVR